MNKCRNALQVFNITTLIFCSRSHVHFKTLKLLFLDLVLKKMLEKFSKVFAYELATFGSMWGFCLAIFHFFSFFFSDFFFFIFLVYIFYSQCLFLFLFSYMFLSIFSIQGEIQTRIFQFLFSRVLIT